MKVDDIRLSRESEFFDKFYADESSTFDMAVADRYRKFSARRLYSQEYRIAALGELHGRSVVDVGCGTGTNSVLLALLGANVTGIDVSNVAIARAKSMAKSAGVENQTDFRVEPFERFSKDGTGFDVVWIEAFLHHMLPVFDDAVGALVALAKPNGIVVISEPIRLSATVRALRKLFPANTDATPDERPLERAEIDILHKHLVFEEMQYFDGLSRLSSLFMRDHSYEHATPFRQAAADVLRRIDAQILKIPFLGPMLAGGIVIVGRRASRE